MQLIYALDSIDDQSGKTDPVKILRKKLDETTELFTYLLYFITAVARYAEIDAGKRAAKHLVTAEDLNVNTRLAGNEILWKILESPGYISAIAEHKPASIDDNGAIRKTYNTLLTTPQFKEYIALPARNTTAEKDILKFVFTDLMLAEDEFTTFIEEHFTNWQDDADMMMQLVMNYLSKPNGFDLRNLMSSEKSEFARDLLTTTLEKKEFLTEIVKPKLKNWDADRIALLDMILLQMGICELLYFETIPPKVTINEYIDIAKEYSTEQSGQFINGLLDNIHKEFLRDNKIHKIDFRQKS